jgi:hypothetical protein
MPTETSRARMRARDHMNRTSRKRSLLEISGCVVLVAALAVQPALGRDGKGKSGREAAAAPTQSAVAAPAAAPAATRKAAAPARTARRTSTSTTARRGVRQAPAPADPPPVSTAQVPADPAPAPPVATAPPPPADPPPVPMPAPAAAPEDGAGSAPVPTAPAPPPPAATTDAPATAPAPPPASAPDASRSPVAEENAVAQTAAPTPSGATPAESERDFIVTTPNPGTTSSPQVEAGAAATDALDPVVEATASGPPSATSSPAGANGQVSGLDPSSDAGRAQARGTGGAAGTVAAAIDGRTGGTAPDSAISDPLSTPASARILGIGVRDAAGFQTSRPTSAADNVENLRSPTPTVFTRVGDAVNVVPKEMWIALAALGVLVLLLGANTVLAAARTRRLERHREKLMEDIGLLQAALLPAVPARMGALLTTVAYRPADGPAAGGDFYDAFPLPDGKVALLLGDVSGHGRQALAKTTLVRFTVRAHLEAGMSPREAIAIAGRSLDGRLADDFSTVLAAIHDPATGTLTYASAGHPPPLVLGPSAHAPVTASSAPPIGVGFPTGQRQTMVPMPEGTTVAVYSDGLLEARIAGEPLGAERLATWLAELGPDATAKQLLDLVVQRADRVPDDLAAVVIHAAPGATAPASRVEQLKLDVLDVDGPDLEGFLTAAGVGRNARVIAGRRVSEQLAISGGVIVEVRTGEHPTVSVYAIGDRTAAAQRQTSAH